MSSVPVFEKFAVEEFGLYPGTPKRPGLDFKLGGLTLVLGANGLGKTTLVTMLYRMCTGPSDLRGSPGNAQLGGRRLELVTMSGGSRRVFAQRVFDDAVDSTATLTMLVGDTRFHLTRRLRDLTLVTLEVGAVDLEPDEDQFQRLIADAAGVPTFSDWLLFLRYLVFYFEDRSALVWDPSAQRQLIRLLFFPANRAREWAEREQAIQALDSRMRNLQAVLTRQEVNLAHQESASKSAPAIREELAALARLQEIDQPRLDGANETILQLDAERQRARLDALTAERDHDSAYRNLERLELRVIDSAFPSRGETAKYILAHLFSNSECLACAQMSPDAASEMRLRIEDGRCVVCGSTIEAGSPTPISSRAIRKAQTLLSLTAQRLEAAIRVREDTESTYEVRQEIVHALAAEVSGRRARMDELLARLPPEEAAVHERRGELRSLRGEVEMMKVELSALREDFNLFIGSVTADMGARAEAVKQSFDKYASDFLLDSIELVWAPHDDTVGQSGPQVSYPAFELVMGGAGFPSAVRRSGPEQVSESQREFIDLAFRMTLMTVGTTGHAGSLVIDAPESSLDAVFVRRAADVLNRFAVGSEGNCLLVTSNLTEGDLIPELLRKAGIKSARDHRVVDLLKMAAPTVATTQLSDEYSRVRAHIFQRANRQ
jgi:energy-coupling factor transporter ATP-binding protein EcfA2